MRSTIKSPSVGRFYTTNAELVVVDCCKCYIRFAIPAELDRHACEYSSAAHPRNYVSITCPAGHKWHYTGRNEEQELARKLKDQRDRAGRLAHERDQAKASAAAHKGHNTRIRKRIANGICPCCNRTFKDVARHMKSQHPEFSQQEDK